MAYHCRRRRSFGVRCEVSCCEAGDKAQRCETRPVPQEDIDVKRNSRRKIRKLCFGMSVLLGMLLLRSGSSVEVRAAQDQAAQDQAAKEKRLEYQAYQERLGSIHDRGEISEKGFSVLEDQVFKASLENLGEVTFLPALDEKYHRLALFFADEEETIVYRTDQLEMNFLKSGELAQPVQGVSAVSFQDVNGDGRTDIVLIASCSNGSMKKAFQIGEVLFADEKGFYRDYRISDKINRFGMNKSIDLITAYARDGRSTEFLYTATTLKELQENGFDTILEQSYYREFEKLGRLLVVPGSITIANYEIFMIYLVNDQGVIVWSFQPMAMYDSLYALRGISCRDIDGDGLKDIVVLARYSDETVPQQRQIVSDYAIYYQRTGGFVEDIEFKKHYACDENTKMEDLVREAREYWGYTEE